MLKKKMPELSGEFEEVLGRSVWYHFHSENKSIDVCFSRGETGIGNVWCVKTYVTEGHDCTGHYNPTIMLRPDGRGLILNPEWTLEATKENLLKIAKEIERRAKEEIKL